MDKASIIMAMLGAQEAAQAQADTQVRKVLGKALEDSPDARCDCGTCRTGDCCRIAAMVTPMDAMPIAWHIHTSGLNTASLRRRYAENGERALKIIVKCKQDMEPVRCVLLDENNECSHYERRPIACRIHYVLSGADSCRPYCERNDGLQPIVALLGVGELATFAVYLAQGAMRSCGYRDADELPWLQPVGLQLAVMLRALQLPDWQFVGYLAKHGTISVKTIEKIYESQTKGLEAVLEHNRAQQLCD